ncbi:hypothetical protein PENSPDRAFT_694237 [Peniophora sp. CONT]|nr:hypothetical protein PENSPDRAFT_694237 [Peniophora sp. CONT]
MQLLRDNLTIFKVLRGHSTTLPLATATLFRNSEVFLYRMIADYHRYLADFASSGERHNAEDKSLEARKT